MTDLNGNQLTITPNGINHSSDEEAEEAVGKFRHGALYGGFVVWDAGDQRGVGHAVPVEQ